jgi:glycosyltransferase involved in cell wall biosynthesis
MLLRASGQVYDKNSSFRCVFVGLTDDVIENNYAIREAISNTSVKRAAICLPKLSYPDLASLYRLAEFTVYPSHSEGFGLPILEAAAAEKLCLCGDNSSMGEIQTDPQYRVNSESEEAWVQKIIQLWGNSDITKKSGKICGQIGKRYSWHKSAEKIWEILLN